MMTQRRNQDFFCSFYKILLIGVICSSLLLKSVSHLLGDSLTVSIKAAQKDKMIHFKTK